MSQKLHDDIAASPVLSGLIARAEELDGPEAAERALARGAIVAASPAAGPIGRLHELLPSCPVSGHAHPDTLEFYGVRRSPGGAWERFVIYRGATAPALSGPGPEPGPGPVGHSPLGGLRHESGARPEARVHPGARWLEGHALTDGGAAGVVNLYEAAMMVKDHVFVHMAYESPFPDPPTFNLASTVFGVACNVVANGESVDYYSVQQQLVLSPNQVPGQNYGADWYHFSVAPRGFGDRPDLVGLVVTSPSTTTGSETTSSSVNHSVSGHIGFFGGMATGGLSGGASFSKSKSFSTPGVVTSNYSGSTPPNAARWMFGVKGKSPVHKATFQPFVQGLWRADRHAIARARAYPGLEFVTSFKADLSWSLPVLPRIKFSLVMPDHVTLLARPPMYQPDKRPKKARLGLSPRWNPIGPEERVRVDDMEDRLVVAFARGDRPEGGSPLMELYELELFPSDHADDQLTARTISLFTELVAHQNNRPADLRFESARVFYTSAWDAFVDRAREELLDLDGGVGTLTPLGNDGLGHALEVDGDSFEFQAVDDSDDDSDDSDGDGDGDGDGDDGNADRPIDPNGQGDGGDGDGDGDGGEHNGGGEDGGFDPPGEDDLPPAEEEALASSGPSDSC